MKLHYSPTEVGFEWGQRSLYFTIEPNGEIKIEFCDPNELNPKGNMFRKYLYMSIEEQKALKKLLKRSLK